MNIRKREANAILQAFSGGVVPRIGLEHVIVGRRNETEQIIRELGHVKQGAAIPKVFIGDFGSGKSFILSIIRHVAFKEKFAVADVDFSPERRLYGSEGKAVATYTELMRNLSIPTRPDGNALPNILEKWIADIQNIVQQEKGYANVAFDNPDFVRDVHLKISQVLADMEELVGAFDFAKVINAYYEGYVQDNSHLQSSSIRWLRGEYRTRTEARQDLGVRDVIDDSNWYDYLKVIAKFITKVGYSGLVVNFDEAINLYKITHAQTREKNYESILKIFNDCLQGKAEHMYLTFAGTSEFLEDERRGLFSYAALKRRLVTNRFETAEYRDLSQPVIKLSALRKEELFVLLQKIRGIHAANHDYQTTVTDGDIQAFMQELYARPGAEERLTPGIVVRDFIGALSVLYQNPEMDRTVIFKSVSAADDQGTTSSVLDRFQRVTRS